MSPRLTIVRLPNLLSGSRFVLAAGFAVSETTGAREPAVEEVRERGHPDQPDARRVDATSRWGAMLDPIADRVFVLSAVGTLLFTGQLGTAAYFVLIMRDLATAIGFIVARAIPWLRPVVFKARPAGKLVTVLQLITLAAVLLAPAVVHSLLIIVALVSAVSIVDYTVALWRARAR
jgi:phosphatidylglycerophosphate synthase